MGYVISDEEHQPLGRTMSAAEYDPAVRAARDSGKWVELELDLSSEDGDLSKIKSRIRGRAKALYDSGVDFAQTVEDESGREMLPFRTRELANTGRRVNKTKV